MKSCLKFFACESAKFDLSNLPKLACNTVTSATSPNIYFLVDGGKYQFARADSAQKAASLLGVPVEILSKLIFHVASGGKRMRTSSSASLKRSNSSISTVSSLSYQVWSAEDVVCL